MADLTAQNVSATGLSPTYAAADVAGDAFVNNGQRLLAVRNDDASDKTVTIDSQAQCDQGFDHDIAVTVAAGGEQIIGPFPPARWNDADRKVQVSYSAVTSVTVAVLEI